MILMIDHYDSFVYNLVHYVLELGEEILVFRHDAISIPEVEALSPSGIILSPGPKSPSDAGISVELIRTFGDRIPILGVCLGHQVIAHALGGKVVKGQKPMHGKLSPVRHEQVGVFKQIPSPMLVTRYHSLVVEPSTLPDDVTITAKSEDGEIMGIKHNTLLLEGIQFHPEAILTEYGHELLANFIAWCREVNDEHGASYSSNKNKP